MINSKGIHLSSNYRNLHFITLVLYRFEEFFDLMRISLWEIISSINYHHFWWHWIIFWMIRSYYLDDSELLFGLFLDYPMIDLLAMPVSTIQDSILSRHGSWIKWVFVTHGVTPGDFCWNWLEYGADLGL